MKKPATAKTVGKPAHHAKPAKAAAGKKTAPTRTKKHAGSKKHQLTAHQKHLAHVAHLAHLQHTRRGLAIGEGAACCSAEALAASLRLAGGTASDDDVLALHWAVAGDWDTGSSIWAALESAAESGLAGMRPQWFGPIGSGARGVGPPADIGPLRVPPFTGAHIPTATLARHRPAGTASASRGTSVVLGLDLPGAHAVTVDARGRWWSWGQPYDPSAFPDAVVEEAWAVTWQ